MKLWKILLVSALGGGCLILFFHKVDWAGVGRSAERIPLVYPVLFALGIFLSYLIRAWRWGILLRPYGESEFKNRYNSIVIGYLVTYLLPGRLGEVARPAYLARKENTKLASALATVVFERLVDAWLILTLLALSLGFLFRGGSPGLTHLRSAALWGTGILFAGLVFVLLCRVPAFLNLVERGLRRISRALPGAAREKTVQTVLSFLSALLPRLNRKQTLFYGFGTILLWTLIIGQYWLLSLAFAGMQLGMSKAVIYFAVVFFSSAVPTPGMAGSLDLASRFALTVLFGVEEQTAIAYTILFHFLLLAVTFVLGALVGWREGWSFSRIRMLGKES